MIRSSGLAHAHRAKYCPLPFSDYLKRNTGSIGPQRIHTCICCSRQLADSGSSVVNAPCQIVLVALGSHKAAQCLRVGLGRCHPLLPLLGKKCASLCAGCTHNRYLQWARFSGDHWGTPCFHGRGHCYNACAVAPGVAALAPPLLPWSLELGSPRRPKSKGYAGL